MNRKPNESFGRWQGRQIQQLSFVNNLFIALGTGILAFQMPLPFENTLRAGSEEWLFIASAAMNVLSIGVGGYVAWNRLLSFRSSTRAARIREKFPVNTRPSEKQEEYKARQAEYKAYDALTWKYLPIQILVFVAASTVLLALMLVRVIQ